MADLISKPAWRYTIGDTPELTPFWGPNFSPPCGQLAAPYLYAHKEPGPNSKLCTQMEVLVTCSRGGPATGRCGDTHR